MSKALLNFELIVQIDDLIDADLNNTVLSQEIRS